jgi:predicted nucleotidyltransferase
MPLEQMCRDGMAREVEVAMKTVNDVLPGAEASKLSDYKRAVERALPGVDKLILFGSRARAQARSDSDYDVAVVVRNLSDRRHVRRILSDLAYDHILGGFFIRPIPLSPDHFEPLAGQLTELAEEIVRDGVEVT